MFLSDYFESGAEIQVWDTRNLCAHELLVHHLHALTSGFDLSTMSGTSASAYRTFNSASAFGCLVTASWQLVSSLYTLVLHNYMESYDRGRLYRGFPWSWL